MSSFHLDGIPAELHWENDPLAWSAAGDSLSVTVGEKTDWFTEPAGSYAWENAPRALFIPPDSDFLLSARVAVEFGSVFDAGALLVQAREDLWAKLCFEYSPQGQPMIVSVVTRRASDDCNSAVIAGREVFLRIAQSARATSFHYSLDGQYWQFVRYFTLGNLERLKAGFSAQSPTGKACTAIFSEIHYRPGVLIDNRSGE